MDDFTLIRAPKLFKEAEKVLGDMTKEDFYGKSLKLLHQKTDKGFGFVVETAGGMVTLRPHLKYVEETTNEKGDAR